MLTAEKRERGARRRRPPGGKGTTPQFVHFLLGRDLAGFLQGGRNLFVQVALQLVERLLDVFGRTAAFIDVADPLLDVDARFQRPEHFIRCAEDAVEQLGWCTLRSL
ncbi:MAG TPA: hypothetical protein VMV69_17790 [Pirellulales bacterium]|nr:hypothetical protein [Pirellulales bacterium]